MAKVKVLSFLQSKAFQDLLKVALGAVGAIIGVDLAN